jgi:hypothetical protein
VTGWVGWIVFAATMLLVIGSMNLVVGLAALFQDEIFLAGDAGAFVLDLTAWGWVHIAIAALLIVTGISLYSGATWATVTAAVLVALNMISQMFMLPAYPFWGIVVITLSAFALWALIVHGDEQRHSDL